MGPTDEFYGPSGRRASPQLTKIFLSFQHNLRSFITQKVARWFDAQERGFEGVRLVDRPKYGELFEKEIDLRLAPCTGMIAHWSAEARRSFYVNYEVYRASALGIPICLVKYETEPLPEWWGGRERRAISLKGIDAKDPKNGLPWTDETRPFVTNEFRPVFLSGCLSFAEDVRRGEAPAISGVKKPEKWMFGLGWTDAEQACDTHRWAVGIIHGVPDLNRMIHRDVPRAECAECEVCQRAIIYSRARAGSTESGSQWSELQEAVQRRHGP